MSTTAFTEWMAATQARAEAAGRICRNADLAGLLEFQRELTEAARWLRHPLSAQLLLESWLIRYIDITLNVRGDADRAPEIVRAGVLPEWAVARNPARDPAAVSLLDVVEGGLQAAFLGREVVDDLGDVLAISLGLLE